MTRKRVRRSREPSRRGVRAVGVVVAMLVGASVVMGVVVTVGGGGTAHADALCDQMRARYGSNWPCISVPTNTFNPTTNTPAPTTGADGASSGGPQVGSNIGPGPGTGDGTPIVPVPGQATGPVPQQPSSAGPPVGSTVSPAPDLTLEQSVPAAGQATLPAPATPRAPRPQSARTPAAGGLASSWTRSGTPPQERSRSVIDRILGPFRHDAQFYECQGYEGSWWLHTSRSMCVAVDGNGLYVQSITVSAQRSGGNDGSSLQNTKIRWHIQGPDGKNSQDVVGDLTQQDYSAIILVNNYMEAGKYTVWFQTQDVDGNWSEWKGKSFEIHG